LRSSPFRVDRRMPCHTVLTSAGASFPSSDRIFGPFAQVLDAFIRHCVGTRQGVVHSLSAGLIGGLQFVLFRARSRPRIAQAMARVLNPAGRPRPRRLLSKNAAADADMVCRPFMTLTRQRLCVAAAERLRFLNAQRTELPVRWISGLIGLGIRHREGVARTWQPVPPVSLLKGNHAAANSCSPPFHWVHRPAAREVGRETVTRHGRARRR
jgi:hypothetical protein